MTQAVPTAMRTPAAPASIGVTVADGLLAGPAAAFGAERLGSHDARLGDLPHLDAALIDVLLESGLRGRGGAAFPAGVKWRSVAERSRGHAVVIANGAEGEPLSHKDRTLVALRPHLVIDGAVLAARAVRATRIVVYVGEDHVAAVQAIRNALQERRGRDGVRIDIDPAPVRYVSGEETAAVRHVDTGVGLPIHREQRPYESGVRGRPTLVQNVETLAHAALIARRGAEWFRARGVDGASGSILVTVSGAVARPGVIEVRAGSRLGNVLDAAGAAAGSPALLLGGYFGGWVGTGRARALRLDAPPLREQGHALGCGIVAVLSPQSCGIAESAAVVRYLAEQSARQCGPCVFGLRAIAGAVDDLAAGRASEDSMLRLRRWTGELPGRGACRHPDGAAGFMRSALETFGDEIAAHLRGGCHAAPAQRRAA